MYMYVVIYCSFIFTIFYFSSEILAKFSYSVNPRLNKVYVCNRLSFTSTRRQKIWARGQLLAQYAANGVELCPGENL